MSCRHAVLWVALLAAGSTAFAQEQAPATPVIVDTGPVPEPLLPLWELGIGLSGLRLPDYRGSDESHSYLLPFPHFIYRGKWLRSDRDGMRAMLFDSPRAKLDVSFGAAAPTRSGNTAREGMPDRPGNAEVGPSIVVRLDEAAQQRWKLELRLPVRGAISLESSPRYVGTTFSPSINLDVKGDAEVWRFGMLAGPLFADRRYHEHYYSVDAAYATTQRPAYAARGGYAGWQTLASTSRRFGDAWFGAFVRHESLRGAVYEDSPLVRRKSSLAVGFGVTWVLTRSSEMVAASNE